MATTNAKDEKFADKFKSFFRGVMNELKKVHWPNKKQLATYTGVVIVMVLIMAVAISLMDLGFSSLLELVLSV